MRLSLSNFFPENTEYFYFFPTGDKSNYFNSVPTWNEELSAGRLLVCAGQKVRVIVFSITKQRALRKLMRDFGIPVDNGGTLYLPQQIKATVEGEKRSNMIKQALANMASRRLLSVAQPFLEEKLEAFYQLPAAVSIFYNDKKNMPQFIAAELLPKKYGTFTSGKDFFASDDTIPFPCVIKISSSGGGDGVRLCHNIQELRSAKKEFKNVIGTIFAEEFIDAVMNVGVQFGIPYNRKKPIEVIGWNKQIINDKGEFIGSVIVPGEKDARYDKIANVLKKRILPAVRKSGWYGVGSFDVLIKKDNSFYFIDSNFRVTSTTPYLYMVKNKLIKKPVITFTGRFFGTEAQFRKKILPLAKPGQTQAMQIISLTQGKGVYNFNAVMYFNNEKALPQNAQRLVGAGIVSPALHSFC